MRELLAAFNALAGVIMEFFSITIGRLLGIIWLVFRPVFGKNKGLAGSVLVHAIIIVLITFIAATGSQEGSPYSEEGVVMIEDVPADATKAKVDKQEKSEEIIEIKKEAEKLKEAIKQIDKQEPVKPPEPIKEAEPEPEIEIKKKLEEKRKEEELKKIEQEKIIEQQKKKQEELLKEKKEQEERDKKELEEKKKDLEKKKQEEEKKKAEEKAKEKEKKNIDSSFDDLLKDLSKESDVAKPSSGKNAKPSDKKQGGQKASKNYSTKISEAQRGLIKRQIEDNTRTLDGRKDFEGMTATYKIRISASGVIEYIEHVSGGRFDPSHPTYRVFMQEMKSAIEKTRQIKGFSGEPLELELEFGPFE